MVVEAFGKSKGEIDATVNNILKKNGGSQEPGILTTFEKKGIIGIEKSDVDMEKLEEDAIELGVEDIETDGDFVTLTCGPLEFSNVSQQVRDRYKDKVVHSQIEYIPSFYAEPSARDRAMNRALIEALNASPYVTVTGIHHNGNF